jgi:hypothetical protein
MLFSLRVQILGESICVNEGDIPVSKDEVSFARAWLAATKSNSNSVIF